jgi:hypothetical protein
MTNAVREGRPTVIRTMGQFRRCGSHPLFSVDILPDLLHPRVGCLGRRSTSLPDIPLLRNEPNF